MIARARVRVLKCPTVYFECDARSSSKNTLRYGDSTFALYVTDSASREHKQNVAEERDLQEQRKAQGRAEQRQ